MRVKKRIPPSEAAEKWLRRAIVAMVALLPLIVAPGVEHPFSSPKAFMLEGFVLTAGICSLFFRRWNFHALPTPFLLSLAAWTVSIVLSAFFGDFLSLRAFFLSLASVGWFFLILSFRPKVIHVIGAMVLSSLLIAFISLLQYSGLDPFQFLGLVPTPHSDPRMAVIGTLGNPNFVAAILVAGLVLTLALGKTLKRPVETGFAVALQALAIVATGSRASIAGLGVALLWLAGVKTFARPSFLILGALVVATLPVFMHSRPLATTISGRLYVWRVAAPHLLERPWSGYGQGAFEPKYVEWETLYWREGRGSSDDRPFAQLQEHAHNDYLETLVESGMFGAVSLLSLVATFLAVAHRNLAGGTELLSSGASAAVAGLGAVAFVDFPLHRPTELLFWWTCMAVVFLTPPLPAEEKGRMANRRKKKGGGSC